METQSDNENESGVETETESETENYDNAPSFFHFENESENNNDDNESVSSITTSSTGTETPFLDKLSDTELIELIELIFEITDEYIQNNLLQIANELFHKNLIDNCTDLLFDQWEDADILGKNYTDDDYDEIHDFVEMQIDAYFESTMAVCPPRSYPNANIRRKVDVDIITNKIAYLQGVEQPKQRSPEWYEFRHNLISASNLGKIFSSEAQYNSLIYEKCKPLDTSNSDNGYVNTNSPMHWGQKYEPLTLMLYEKMYNTKVADYGCIRHSKYPFIGASPDGINVDSKSDRYGRMVEVKNVVNRELNGIPKEIYWIQTQIQMETCDLDECDFIETQFKEYEDESAFYRDESREHRGIILYFVERVSIGGVPNYSNAPHYEYMPLFKPITEESIVQWIRGKCLYLKREYTLYSTIYWYLDNYSCVLIERNREWFSAAVPKIDEAWKTILTERETGYEHRSAKKRVPKIEVVASDDQSNTSQYIRNLPLSNNVCLVKLDHN